MREICFSAYWNFQRKGYKNALIKFSMPFGISLSNSLKITEHNFHTS